RRRFPAAYRHHQHPHHQIFRRLVEHAAPAREPDALRQARHRSLHAAAAAGDGRGVHRAFHVAGLPALADGNRGAAAESAPPGRRGMSGPYFYYILAAYVFCFALLGGLTLATLWRWKKIKKELGE